MRRRRTRVIRRRPRTLSGFRSIARRWKPIPWLKFVPTPNWKKTVRLRYYGYGTMTPTATRYTEIHAFQLNSLWDPDTTGAGHQPYGYDEVTDFVTQYRVIACKWKLVMSQDYGNPSSMDDVYMVSNIYSNETGPMIDFTAGTFTAATDHVAMFERPTAGLKYKRLMTHGNANGKVFRKLQGFTRMRPFSKNKHDWDDQWTAYTAEPTTRAVFLQMAVVREQGGQFSGSEKFHWTLTLNFIAQFRSQAIIGPS